MFIHTMLADLFTRTYLFHPGVFSLGSEKAWFELWEEVIHELEEAEGVSQIACILNQNLFNSLGDPFSFAQAAANSRSSRMSDLSWEHDFSCQYIDTDPSLLWIRVKNPYILSRQDWVQRFLKEIACLRGKNYLILDLRWQSLCNFHIPYYFASLWVDSQIYAPEKFQLVHQGWQERDLPYIYRRRWESLPRRKLESINPEAGPELKQMETGLGQGTALAGPALILVNNCSVLPLYPVLDCLQSLSQIRVVWERSGNFSLPETKRLYYAPGLEVHLNLETPAWEPDLLREKPIDSRELPGLVQKVFAYPKEFKKALELPGPYLAEPLSMQDLPLSRANRLLGLFKVWAVLKNFSPYFSRTYTVTAFLQDWMPQAEAASGLKEYLTMLQRITVGLKDSHARVLHPLLTQEKELAYPLKLGIREGKVVVEEVHADVPFSPGAEILEINGDSVDKITQNMGQRISASSEQALSQTVLHLLTRGKKGQNLQLKVKQGASQVRAELQPVSEQEIQNQVGHKYKAGLDAAFAFSEVHRHLRRLKPDIAYLKPFQLPGEKALLEAFGLIQDCQGLILDFRGYPRKPFWQTLTRLLCPEPVTSPKYEILELKINESGQESRKLIQYKLSPYPDKEYRYHKPVVALISPETISSAEEFCLHLKSNGRAYFVGQATAGCSGNPASILLPAGAEMSFTGMQVLWPDNSAFFGNGVQPDLEVNPGIQGLLQNRDEILNQGLEVMQKLLTAKNKS
jgi:C-terminal processing protease CtpA/Prc